MKKTRRTFTDDFRLKAIKMVKEDGKSVHFVCKKLKFSPPVLYRWLKVEAPDKFELALRDFCVNLNTFAHQTKEFVSTLKKEAEKAKRTDQKKEL